MHDERPEWARRLQHLRRSRRWTQDRDLQVLVERELVLTSRLTSDASYTEALYTSWLSETHLEAGNIGQAAAHATRTALTASARSDERVQTLATKLHPDKTSPAVNDFIEATTTDRAGVRAENDWP
jgi:hypothetical protein